MAAKPAPRSFVVLLVGATALLAYTLWPIAYELIVAAVLATTL